MKRPFWVPALALLLLIVAIGIYQLLFRPGESSFEVRQFQGNIVSIDGGTVTLNGLPRIVKPATALNQTNQNFEFKVDGSTQFEKIVTRHPSFAELKASGKVVDGAAKYTIEPAPKEKGSLEDLKSVGAKKVMVMVDLKEESGNLGKPTASYVFYHVQIFPSEN